MTDAVLITVVETRQYILMTEGVLDDALRASIVDMIAADPASGDVMRDTGGLRKVRVALPGRGKSGGGRIITFFHDTGMPVFLLAFYAKNAQADLSAEQRKVAKKITHAICMQYGR